MNKKNNSVTYCILFHRYHNLCSKFKNIVILNDEKDLNKTMQLLIIV